MRDCVLSFVRSGYRCAGVLHQVAPRRLHGLRWVRSVLGADTYFVRCRTDGFLGGNPASAFEFQWVCFWVSRSQTYFLAFVFGTTGCILGTASSI